MPSSGMQYVQRKLHRSVIEIRRSSIRRPNGSIRSCVVRSPAMSTAYGASCTGRPSDGRSGVATQEQHGDVGTGGHAGAVGHHGHGVGQRGGGELMASLGADRADVVAAVVGELAV